MIISFKVKLKLIKIYIIKAKLDNDGTMERMEVVCCVKKMKMDVVVYSRGEDEKEEKENLYAHFLKKN